MGIGATLYIHPISPFARKVMVLNRLYSLDISEVIPDKSDGRGYAAGGNPLGKIPALALDDGTLIADSPVICEWLDRHGPNHLSKSSDPMAARSLHAMGDGLATAVYDYRYETVRPQTLHWPDMIARKTEAIRATVLWLEDRVGSLSGPIGGVSWGGLSVSTALDYADFRAPHVPWRDLAPSLADWHAHATDHPAWRDCDGYAAAR